MNINDRIKEERQRDSLAQQALIMKTKKYLAKKLLPWIATVLTLFRYHRKLSLIVDKLLVLAEGH